MSSKVLKFSDMKDSASKRYQKKTEKILKKFLFYGCLECLDVNINGPTENICHMNKRFHFISKTAKNKDLVTYNRLGTGIIRLKPLISCRGVLTSFKA